jgi:trigger factor
VARAEELEVSAEELGAEIAGLAAALGREPKEVARTLERSGQVVSLAGDILRSKALDVVVNHAEIAGEGESRAADQASAEAEEPSELPEDDPSEGEP